jgi:RND family efflux transporter MFP subunit
MLKVRVLSIAVAVLLLGQGGCGQSSAKTGRTRPPPLVSVARARIQDVPVEARAPVDLKPQALADIGSKTLGYLDAVLVDRGDRVKRGQLLALVRPSDLPDQLAALRGTLAQIQSNVGLARGNASRAKQLAPSGVVSQQELENSSNAVTAGEASEAAVKAQIAAIATRLGETRITSPLDGYVWQRRLDPGALVGLAGGSVILTVVQTETLRVFINVNERQATGVRVGQPAWVEVDALPGRRFEGRVTRLAPGFDPLTRTLETEVRIGNSEGLLRPGMYGRGGIVIDVHRRAVVVPAGALQASDERFYVFELQGDAVRRRPVELGIDGGEWLEIARGLTGTEEVVIAGVDSLSDKTRVRPVRNIDPYTGERVVESGPASRPAATGHR